MRIGWGTDAIIDSIGIGNVELVSKGNKIVLENCLHVPNFQYNLIRQNQFSKLEDDDIDELALLGTNYNEPRSYKEAIKSPDWPHW